MVRIYEGGLSRTYQMMSDPKKVFAMISAERQDKTPAENKKRTQALIKDLNDMGYGYTHMAGGYWEVGQLKPGYEHSLLIPNISKEEALKLGAKYDQDTVLYKDETGLKYYKPDGEVAMEFSTDKITVDDKFQLDKVKPYFSRRMKGGNKRNAFSFQPKDENFQLFAFEPYTVKGNHRAYLNAVAESDYTTDYSIKKDEAYTMENLLDEDFETDNVGALADYLEVDPEEIMTRNYDHYGLPILTYGDEEYAVTDNYEDAEKAAKEDVINLIDELGYDALNWGAMGGIENYVDTDWFETARQEDNEFYAQDIHDSEFDRFVDELKNYGLDANDPKYELDNPDGDHSVAIEDFASAMEENQEDNPVEWYIDNFGKEDFNNIVKRMNLLQEEDAAEEVISTDGVGHILSGYDGKEIEHEYNNQTYYIYRLN